MKLTFNTPSENYIILSEQGNTYFGFDALQIMHSFNHKTNYRGTNEELLVIAKEYIYKEIPYCIELVLDGDLVFTSGYKLEEI